MSQPTVGGALPRQEDMNCIRKVAEKAMFPHALIAPFKDPPLSCCLVSIRGTEMKTRRKGNTCPYIKICTNKS